MPKLHLEKSKPCAYLPEQQSANLVFWENKVKVEDWDELVASGWRHFGNLFFRPNCQSCNKCQGIRVSVAYFKESKSQRRVIQKAKELTTQVLDHPPKDALDLLNAFQRERHETLGWPLEEYSQAELESSFVGTFAFSRCLAVYKESELVAFSCFDLGKKTLNSIYAVCSPKYRNLSLGTFLALKEIEIAQTHNIEWYYLGLYNQEAPSLQYKSRFKPNQTFSYFPE